MMDVWIVLSLGALLVICVAGWVRGRVVLRRARRELATLDHALPFERTDP